MAPACAQTGPVTEALGLTGQLSCHLSVRGPTEQDPGVYAEITLSNGLPDPIRVLRYFTPFEGILGEIFVIYWQDQLLAYNGPMMKRIPPGADDWLLLEPGKELSAQVEISRAWNLSREGKYRLQLRNDISYRVAEAPESHQLVAARCGEARFSL